jgi:hypothetical protein
MGNGQWAKRIFLNLTFKSTYQQFNLSTQSTIQQSNHSTI